MSHIRRGVMRAARRNVSTLVPPALRSYRQVSTKNVQTVQVERPAGVVEGDVVVIAAALAWGFDGTFQLPDGFTVAASVDRGLNQPKLLVGWKRVGGAEPPAYVMQVPSTAPTRIDALAFREAHPSREIRAAGHATQTGAVHSPPNVVPVTTGDLAVTFLAAAATGVTMSWEGPANTQKITDASFEFVSLASFVEVPLEQDRRSPRGLFRWEPLPGGRVRLESLRPQNASQYWGIDWAVGGDSPGIGSTQLYGPVVEFDLPAGAINAGVEHETEGVAGYGLEYVQLFGVGRPNLLAADYGWTGARPFALTSSDGAARAAMAAVVTVPSTFALLPTGG